MQVYFKYFTLCPRYRNVLVTGNFAFIRYTCTNGQTPERPEVWPNGSPKLWPNERPNDSERSPERFRSNDSVNMPERLFTSNRTNMFQVLFIILCLLVPAFNDWTSECND